MHNMLFQPKTTIVHPNPQVFNLVAWLLSTDPFKIKAFQQTLEPYWQPHGGLEHKKIILSSSASSVAGVVHGTLIPIKQL